MPRNTPAHFQRNGSLLEVQRRLGLRFCFEVTLKQEKSKTSAMFTTLSLVTGRLARGIPIVLLTLGVVKLMVLLRFRV